MIATLDELAIWAVGSATPTAVQNTVLLTLQARAERAVKDYLGYEVEQATFTEYWPPDEMGGWRGDDPDFVNYEEVGGNVVAYMAGPEERAIIRVKNRPLRSVTSIHENVNAWVTNPTTGDWPASALLAAGSAYQIDWEAPGLCTSGIIRRRYGGWFLGARATRVIYVGGFTPAELAITGKYPHFKCAVQDTVLANYNQWVAQTSREGGLQPGAITSQSIDGISRSVDAETARRLTGMQVVLPPNVMRDLEPHRTMAIF